LHDLGRRQGITGIPTNGSDDHVGWPAVAGERRRGIGSEVTLAEAAAVSLQASLVMSVSLRGYLLAVRAMSHGYGVYHEHQIISQTHFFEFAIPLKGKIY
jgi:hypothetical protein